jgi:hypothetical protein
MAVIQMIEELPDIHLQHPAPFDIHQLTPEALQRLVCRSSGPEAIRAVQKVLLVDRFQQHDDRPLQDFILQRRDADGAGLSSRPAFRDVHTPHGGSLVRAGFRAVEQSLQVTLQVLFVFVRRHSVHADRSVLAGSSVRFFQPVDVHQVGQRGERHLRRLFRQSRYPFLFRGHAFRISRHSSCFSVTVP